MWWVVVVTVLALGCSETPGPKDPAAETEAQRNVRVAPPPRASGTRSEFASRPEGRDDEPDADGGRGTVVHVEGFDHSDWTAFLEALVGQQPKQPSPGCAGLARDTVNGKRDRAARKKIDEVFSWRLSTAMDKYLADLLGTSKACEDECTAATQARLWMYAGTVYGSGKLYRRGAFCAFTVAMRWDPSVALDAALATDDTKKAFAAAHEYVCLGGDP